MEDEAERFAAIEQQIDFRRKEQLAYLALPLPSGFVTTLMFLFGLLTLFGIVENLTMIILVLLTRKLRTFHNILIANLAMSNFAIACTMIPFTFIPSVEIWWHYGGFLCRFYNSFSGANIYCGSLTVCAIAISSWKQVRCRHARSHSHVGTSLKLCRRMAAVLPVIWLLSITAVGPVIIYQHLMPLDDAITIDNVTYNFTITYVCTNELLFMSHSFFARTTYNVLHFVLVLVLPGLVLLFVNVLIRFRLRGTVSWRMHRFRRLSIVLGLMAAAQFLMSVPNVIVECINEYAPNYLSSEKIHVMNVTVQFANCAHVVVNPLLYGCPNRNFRNAFHALLTHVGIAEPQSSAASTKYNLSVIPNVLPSPTMSRKWTTTRTPSCSTMGRALVLRTVSFSEDSV